jgi:hypothetical protein
MATTKIKIAAATLVAAGVVTPYIVQHRALDRLKTENEQLRSQIANPPAMAPVYAADADELARLQGEHQELLRLRGQVAALRRERDDLARQVAAKTSARTNQPAPVDQNSADRAWVQSMLNGPLAQQGTAAGSFRGKTLRNEPVTAAEVALRDALSNQQLNQTLERSPSEFADFQTAFIQATVGINDPAKVAQIHDLVRATYERAVAQGLDIPSKPASDAEDWVQKRHQLDRRATGAVQNVLTEEEKRLFNRAFLGVMGIDLGTGVDKSNYPPGFLGR